MSSISLIFPHQLFQENPCVQKGRVIHIIEESLFFTQYDFHRQKLVYHRATMKRYQKYLQDKGYEVVYIEATNPLHDIRTYLTEHISDISEVHYVDVVDTWLEERLRTSCAKQDIDIVRYDSPMFLNAESELSDFFSDKDSFFQATWYSGERKKRKILTTESGSPVGGKWSFDAENRKKYPKNQTPPSMTTFSEDSFFQEAVVYVGDNFPNVLGSTEEQIYPIDFDQSNTWLQVFFAERFSVFGDYEDAIVSQEHFLHHSVITPMLNTGLLTPKYVIDEAISYADRHEIPLNSLEGFVRQIVGWREFIRGLYVHVGTPQRTRNFWGYTRKIPASFYDGTTGIEPIDITIKKVLETGYCHHIERLMVLGNFMLLCEFDPDEVYKWFMEMFIDAYDWVMVPNIYGMSQFADGGMMATKPYISGSNYLMKMSNYQKGDWQKVWDGLFWRYMNTNREFFLKNPRLGMLVRMYDKMPEEKKEAHLGAAESFLGGISK